MPPFPPCPPAPPDPPTAAFDWNEPPVTVSDPALKIAPPWAVPPAPPLPPAPPSAPPAPAAPIPPSPPLPQSCWVTGSSPSAAPIPPLPPSPPRPPAPPSAPAPPFPPTAWLERNVTCVSVTVPLLIHIEPPFAAAPAAPLPPALPAPPAVPGLPGPPLSVPFEQPPHTPLVPPAPADPAAPSDPWEPAFPGSPAARPFSSVRPVSARAPLVTKCRTAPAPSRATVWPFASMDTVSFEEIVIVWVSTRSGQSTPKRTVPPAWTALRRAFSSQEVSVVEAGRAPAPDAPRSAVRSARQ